MRLWIHKIFARHPSSRLICPSFDDFILEVSQCFEGRVKLQKECIATDCKGSKEGTLLCEKRKRISEFNNNRGERIRDRENEKGKSRTSWRGFWLSRRTESFFSRDNRWREEALLVQLRDQGRKARPSNIVSPFGSIDLCLVRSFFPLNTDIVFSSDWLLNPTSFLLLSCLLMTLSVSVWQEEWKGCVWRGSSSDSYFPCDIKR